MLPLIIFFVVYYFTKNIFLATGVIIVASWLQLLICKVKYKYISKNTWISTILISVFGGLTVILHNKTFVMLKPTVLFWILGTSLLIGQFMGKNGIKLMLGKEISVPEKIWNRLNASWGIFLLLMGGLNLFVALNFSEYFWVKFKVFGSLSLFILFTLISAGVILTAQNKYKQK